MIELPSPKQQEALVNAFSSDLQSYTYVDLVSKQIVPVICSVCDSIATTPHWFSMVSVKHFAKLCEAGALHKSRVKDIYSNEIISCYTVDDIRLEKYILSPKSIIDKEQDTIMVCKSCKVDLQCSYDSNTRKNRRKPPIAAIANGYLIGEPPEELTCLNEIELSLVSKVRIYAQSWVLYAGCHQQIRGWHTFLKNRNTSNVAQLQNLQMSSMKGNIMVVLCGPFTTDQKAIAMKRTQVNPKKVIAAFRWLKNNNYFYENDVLPTENDIPVPIVLENNL